MARIIPQEKPFSTDPSNYAIEKIHNRVKKDVRTATFGVLQYLDSSHQQIGRLRSKAVAQNRRDIWEAKKLLIKGESDIYPQVPALNQRDVRQMRFSPGTKNKPEEFK